jgi:hypothetical protein
MKRIKLFEEFAIANNIDKIKNSLAKYDSITKFYETPYGYKFVMNEKQDLYDKNNEGLPKIECVNFHSSDANWRITKYDFTPQGRPREKVILSTDDIDKIIKTMDKFGSYLLKNKKT